RALALEHRMRFQIDNDVEVARRATVHSRLAFAGQPNPIVLVDPRGYLHRQRLVLLDAAGAVTRHARIGYHLAGAATRWAGLLDREESLRDADLAAAVTGSALLGLRPRLRPGTVTRFARLERRD